jgi:hypothetical protein
MCLKQREPILGTEAETILPLRLQVVLFLKPADLIDIQVNLKITMTLVLTNSLVDKQIMDLKWAWEVVEDLTKITWE